MRKLTTIFMATAMALAVIPANAQTKTTSPTAPATKVAQHAKPTIVSGKMAGMVKGEAKGSTFTLGTKTGTYMVDATKARCTYKGKFFRVSDLKGGNAVVVTGKAVGSTLKATEVKITYIAGKTAVTPKTIKAKTPSKQAKSPTGH